MKNIITILCLLLISSLSFAQNAPIDFEPGGEGADWAWTVFENDDDPPLEIVPNPDPSGINTSATVARFTARTLGAFFAGVESADGNDTGTFDLTPANAIVNIMVYKNRISGVGIKYATPSGGAQMELVEPNTVTNEWELITIDFSQYLGLGETTGLDQIIIYPDYLARTADEIVYFDNITFGPQQAGGGIELPVDFEDPNLNYTIGTFNGTDAAVEANPVSGGINTSATVVRSTKTVGAEFFAGNILDLDTPIDFSTSSSISLKSYSPKANIPVRLALENQMTGNQIVVDVNTTVQNTWETLTFDFTGLLDPAISYNRVVAFFEFVPGLAGDGSVYYFDDVEVATPVSGLVELPEDFEDPTIMYTIGTFNGTDAAVEANPVSGGINTSATVVRSTKTVGAEFFAGNILDLDTPIDFSTSSSISLKSYSPKANIPVRLALENQMTGNQIVVDVNTTVQNTWETLTFDFTGLLDPAISYNRVVAFFEFVPGLAGDGSVYYFDDVEVAPVMTTPVIMPIDYELPIESYVFEGFEGADSAIEMNPDMSGENTSATVMRTIKTSGSQFFAGTFTNIDAPIDFSESGIITMKTWSPKANIPVRMAIENQVTGNQIFVDVNTTVTNTWEMLTFDFTPLIDAAIDYNRVVVFFEFIVDLPGDGSTYFFDDIEVAEPVATPVGLPVDFELPIISYDFEGFEGADSAIEMNPDMSGENTSATVMRTVKTNGSQFFAGTFLNLDIPIEFSENGQIAMKTWSPKANIPVRMALETQGATNNQITIDVNTTVEDAWETLVFDFSSLIDENLNYERVVVFFEFIVDLPGDGSTYYFDDIEVVPLAPESVVMPIDFELPITSYVFEGFEGADSAIEMNPDVSGENTSETVMRTIKTEGSQFFAGTFVNIDEPIDFSEFTGISVKTWSPKANIPVRLAIENQETGNQVFVDVNTTLENTWETLTFDFTDLIDTAIDYNRVVVFFEFIEDLPGDGSTYYFDDIALSEVLSVSQNNVNNVTLFPNPATTTLTMKASTTINTLRIVNMLGQEVYSIRASTQEKTIDVSLLTQGVYFINITLENGIQHTMRFIKK